MQAIMRVHALLSVLSGCPAHGTGSLADGSAGMRRVLIQD